ncbi:MAG: MFS transporter [Acidimicrobiia bacterium]|nr:MFS transporter [Acidimicrobiia bacterium]
MKNYIKSMFHLPYLHNKNISIIYFTYFAASLWFMLGMWYVYFLKIVAPEQIALVHTIGFIIGISMDIPSGYMADKIGRKHFLAIGLLLFSIGIGLFAFITNIWQMIIFEMITQTGIAFITGAQEAVLYDTIYAIEKDKSKVGEIFALIYSRCRMIVNFGLIISPLVGGVLYRFSDKAGWLLMSGFCFVAFLLTLTLTNHQQRGESIEIKILTHTKDSFKIFASKTNRYLIPAILLLSGIAFISDWGIFPQGSMERAGYTPLGISIFFAVIYTLSIISNHYLPSVAKKLGNYLGFKYYGILTVVMLLLGAGIYFVAPRAIVIVLGLFTITSSLFVSYLTIVVSDISNETNRATMLSMSGFSSKFLYMFSAPIVGLSFASNKPEYSWLGFAIIIFISVLMISKIWKKYSI